MAPNVNLGHRERLRQRFLEGDLLEEEAILELLLSYAIPHKDVRPLAHELIASYGSLGRVIDAEPTDLCGFLGVKQATSVLIRLVGWIKDYLNDVPSGTKNCQASMISKPFQAKLELGIEKVALHVAPNTLSSLRGFKTASSIGGALLFANAYLAEGVEMLPILPDTESLSELRQYLQANLRFSAEQTRRRNSQYILRRLFPEGRADIEMRRFAQVFAGRQELRDVCFYRFCKVESLMYLLIEELVVPVLGSGSLPRSAISEFLNHRFPISKSINQCVAAAVDALVAVNAAKKDRSRISITLRDVPIPSLAFIVHSEYETPGIYSISELESNQAIRAMLWHDEQLLPALYELRNLGLISKVSEIDSVRQFTTRYTLAQIVDRLNQGVAP